MSFGLDDGLEISTQQFEEASKLYTTDLLTMIDSARRLATTSRFEASVTALKQEVKSSTVSREWNEMNDDIVGTEFLIDLGKEREMN